MPVRVRIDINGLDKATIYIGRENGGQGEFPDAVNEYRAVRQRGYPTRDEWDEGVLFEHRYGDGVETVVEKALVALRLADEEFDARMREADKLDDII
jgi:hypothetical protein